MFELYGLQASITTGHSLQTSLGRINGVTPLLVARLIDSVCDRMAKCICASCFLVKYFSLNIFRQPPAALPESIRMRAKALGCFLISQAQTTCRAAYV